jgi:hypothetical protein
METMNGGQTRHRQQLRRKHMSRHYIEVLSNETLETIERDYLRENPSVHPMDVSVSWDDEAKRIAVILDDTPIPEPKPRKSSQWEKKQAPARAITR